jgi:hypothetical protein
MAIIVEDGTLVANANSYVTVAEVDTYCENRGLTSWDSLGDEIKEASLLRGMDFIETKPFKGGKSFFDNPLEWPRVNWYQPTNVSAYDIIDYEGVIPLGLKLAVCRAAYEESLVAGCLQEGTSRDDFITRKKIDVLEVEYKLPVSGTVSGIVETYPQIDGHLRTLLMDSTIVKVVRT